MNKSSCSVIAFLDVKGVLLLLLLVSANLAHAQSFSVFAEVDRWGEDIGPPPAYIDANNIGYSYEGVGDFGGTKTLFHMVDFSDLGSPSKLGSKEFDIIQVGGLLAAEDLLFVRNYQGVHILDVSNPADIRLLGLAEVGFGDVTALAYHQDHVYVTGFVGGNGGVVVVDVSNPTQPLVRTVLVETSSDTQQIAISNNHLFARGQFGIAIYDFGNDPSTPDFLMEYMPEEPDFPSEVDIDHMVASGDQLYASGWFKNNTKFYSIDISDPSNPSLLQSINYGSSDESRGLHLSGNMVFVQFQSFSDQQGYDVVNVSNPGDLRVSGKRVVGLDGRLTINLTPTRAYVYFDEMKVYDISHAQFDMPPDSNWGDLNSRLLPTVPFASIREIHLSGRTILAARGNVGIERLTFASNGTLAHQETFDTGAETQSLMVYGDYLHVSTYSGGDAVGDTYLIFEMKPTVEANGSTKIDLIKQAGIKISSKIQDIVVTDKLAILAANTDGLYVYDWSARNNIAYRTRYQPSGFPTPPIEAVDLGSVRLSLYGYYVVGNREASNIGLETFAPPDLQGNLSLVSSPGYTTRYYDIEARDGSLFGFAAIAAGESGLVIADTGPITAGSEFINGFQNVTHFQHDTGGIVQSVALFASYAFLGVTGGNAGVIVVDFSDRENLMQVASFSGVTDVRDIAVSGSYVFALDGDAGIVSIEWSDDGFTGPLPDFDNDGASDALEGFFGNSIEVPGENDGSLPPPQLVEDNGQRVLEITFNVAADLDPNIHWELESAARIDSLFWTTVDNALISQNGTTVTARVPADSVGANYVRLAIQIP
jgi:hypothetical protein